VSGFEKPTHPLISIIDVSEFEIREEHLGMKITTGLYSIGMKDKSCGLQYGRNTYDFDEGVLYFTGPNQLQTVTNTQKKNEIEGWILSFHPDLIRNTSLGKTIDSYNFFEYDVYEALHLSETEQKTITDLVELIKVEISERIDNHSQNVIVSYLELLLNLSKRYYERQFNTRSAEHSDVVSQFQYSLKEYYENGLFREQGTPPIEYFSEKTLLSANYLSDLLKKETGFSAKDQINNFIIEKAKTLLLSETDSVSGIAYTLGFNYPHYFSRMFKSKTGMTPQEYRQLN
jgi:AraC-like DNA-binding protein